MYIYIFPLAKDKGTKSAKGCDIADLFCYLPLWHCVVISVCIKQLPCNGTAVDRGSCISYKKNWL